MVPGTGSEPSRGSLVLKDLAKRPASQSAAQHGDGREPSPRVPRPWPLGSPSTPPLAAAPSGTPHVSVSAREGNQERSCTARWETDTDRAGLNGSVGDRVLPRCATVKLPLEFRHVELSYSLFEITRGRERGW